MRQQPLALPGDTDPSIDLDAHARTSHNTSYSFDYLFLKRFWRLLRLLFKPTSLAPHAFWSPKKEARQNSLFWLYVIFVALSCGNEVLVYFVGLIPSRFYTILTNKDLSGFTQFTVPCLLLVFGASAGKSLVTFMGGLFALKARRLLTEHVQARYIRPKTMYTLVLNHTSIDNPDQRIAQDIERFSDTLRKIVEQLIIMPLLLISYTWQCWKVSGFMGPLFIYAYFILGSVISRRFIKPIVNAVFYKEAQEGYFRFLHVRLRQYAESIAFSHGEKEENIRAKDSLDSLLVLQRSIVNKELPLNLANKSFAYFGSILSYFVIAIPVFAGAFDDKDPGDLSAIISKNSFVSMYLIYLFTSIIEQSSKLSDLAGYTARIAELLEAIEDVDNEIENIEIDYPYREDDQSNNAIEFENVSIWTPQGKNVIINLNLHIAKGEHVIIMGPNGSGKTSVLRALAGLWPCTSGRLHMPKMKHGKDIVFLPQIPYLIEGSLRDQITYPSLASATTISDDEVRSLLEQVHLPHLEYLVDSFDTCYGPQWSKMLSPGEQQRLVFARILYWKPTFAALDEAMSGMDNATEAYLYRLIIDMGVTVISVSHHRDMIQFHRQLVEMDGQGGYQITPIAPLITS
ncbi:ATP-binding cassette sub-family D member 4-like protein [Radiomyces spectabilis]|uniref:ATP-binding cassette sub-family D member 4-like protein n=1 Tax=Radiomyces spectabilis TaxID=64574 RepID=UPI0022205AE6|nr:ATP-binding cassette sub-family D member 4-like protein [Radiomyces spectabilis]KAI8367703.1 ATP-binding cassette sub-family D member 4-like protein [Radiomyces spectabilis]